MERNKLVNFLCYLNSVDDIGKQNCDQALASRYDEVCEKLSCNYDEITRNFTTVTDLYFSSEITGEWKYILLNFHIMKLINDVLEKSEDEILSVQQSRNVKNCVKNIVTVGIATKLHPRLPFYVKLPGNDLDFLVVYNILKCTTVGLCEFLKYPKLRLLILPDSLKEILVATYQLSYCPLKKPSPDNSITPELYNRFLEERGMFLELFDELRSTIHCSIYLKATMVIMHADSPPWFKRAVCQTLTSAIKAKNGVENIARLLLDGVTDDSTQTWKIYELFTKLIQQCKQLPEFDSLCAQVLKLLDKSTDDILVYERMVVNFMRSTYQNDSSLVKDVFMKHVTHFFMCFTNTNYKFTEGEDITGKLHQHVRILHELFIETNPQHPNLPPELLNGMLQVLFHLYCSTLDSTFKTLNDELSNLLLKCLENHQHGRVVVFDSLLFNLTTRDIVCFRKDVQLKSEQGKIFVLQSDHAVTHSISETSECLLRLLKRKQELVIDLFIYLLECLNTSEKYFRKANDELLSLEDQVMNEYFERKLVVYKMLSDLSEDKSIQKAITENPEHIVKYISTTLKRTLELGTHKTTHTDSDSFQLFFTVLMILYNLTTNSFKNDMDHYKYMVEDLKRIHTEIRDAEAKNVIKQILDAIEGGTGKKDATEEKRKETQLDKALEDVCDPLLPTRGHGLMTLTKLLEKKDKATMARRQYLLNLFQQHLKNEDSYIYLSAIGGLAALADVFPDTVLNILCEEYSDVTKEQNDDGHEVRMKIGETLVRVTKILGDMAPKYKPLLLNTFLAGARDNDDLIRASSLSNLGEICRVLGYKLGTIITEILVCVHAIITTDKSPQARRAAVTVLRQLFIGLDTRTIDFLKEDILPIYRTLKAIYRDDKDDVMRLQAQLALEELNENVKNFVFPTPRLSDKKVLVLKSSVRDNDDGD